MSRAFEQKFYAAISPAYEGGMHGATGASYGWRADQSFDALETFDPQLPMFSRRHAIDYEPIHALTVAPSAARPHLWVAGQMAVAPYATHIVKDLIIFNLRDDRVSYASGRPSWLATPSTTWVHIGAPRSWFGSVREFGYSPDTPFPRDHHMLPVASFSDFPEEPMRYEVDDALYRMRCR